MTPEECDEISTRGALIAQLRAQRRVGTMMLTELRECREDAAMMGAAWKDALGRGANLRQENAHLRDLLHQAYVQQPGDHFRDDLRPDKMLKAWFTVAELRAIAALFVEEDK